MDVNKFLADWSAGEAPTKMRLGQARVRSVDSDPVYTITPGQAVIVPTSQEWGTSEIVANYLGEYPPRPGGSCWYATDGVDRIIMGMMGPDGPPSASISLTSATATTTAGTTVIAMTTTEFDPWNMTDTAGTGLTIPATGMYAISGFATWNQNGTGYRELTLRRNGSVLERNRAQTITTAFNPIQNLTLPGFPCNKGDIISMVGIQTSGANLNLNAASLYVQYVGRRRSTSGTATLIADGSFENNDITSSDSAWNFTNATSATWSLDGSFNKFYTGVVGLKGIHAAGTVSTVVSSNTVIPVVPRQKLRISAYVQANAFIASSSTTGAQFLLFTSADGTPQYLETGTTTPAGGTSVITTAYLPITTDITVPAGAFVARVGFKTMSTATNTVWWDEIVATEVIS
jgi:hypothetical protein